MINLKQLEWHDPFSKIWGFHVHQELQLKDFSKALVIQQKCNQFLKQHAIPIDAEDVIKPGYGPHLDYMWELRVESAKSNALENMGVAIAYMAINRFGLSAYIHPLMQDPALPEEEELAIEGKENQANALWFSYRVPQMQDFFFNPPKDDNNKIIDTRTSRIMSSEDRSTLVTLGEGQLKNQSFQDPSKIIIKGFHIHMDYAKDEKDLAYAIFDKFLTYLLDVNMRPTSTRLYGPNENGPHVKGGWEVKFETQDKTILKKIGIAIAWLMCNRQGLPVFMHPVTWDKGNYREELKAHKEYSFFLGELPVLDLTFFSNKIV
jgi:aromatic ring-cleaving dioxygenase